MAELQVGVGELASQNGANRVGNLAAVQSECGRDEAPLVHDVPDGLPSSLLVVGELLGLAVGQKPSGIVARVER